MDLGDVAAEYVGGGVALLVHAHERVDLEPADAILRAGGVLDLADVTAEVLLPAQRLQREATVHLSGVLGQRPLHQAVAGLHIIVGVGEAADDLLHARAQDQAVLAGV